MKLKLSLVTVVFFILAVPTVVFGATWPATGITSANTITMPSPYEPSGLAWNEVTQKLFTVSDPTSDGNRITMMNEDGSNQKTWKKINAGLGTDFEGLTIVDPNSNYIYVGVENRDGIYEFDITSPTDSPRVTKVWDLTPWLQSSDPNRGMEGLTYVPNEFHSYNIDPGHGVFYGGVQRDIDLTDAYTWNDAIIYAFDVNLEVSGDVRLLGALDLHSSLPTRMISDLFFSKDTGTLFILSYNTLYETSPDGQTIFNIYSGVPGGGEEGFVLDITPGSNMAEVYIAHDNDRTVTRHFNFPVTVLVQDSDGDGVLDDEDMCPGYNDAFDIDEDGIPDGCDDHDDRFCERVIGETGKVSVLQKDDAEWHRVELENTYADPVVIAQMSTYNGGNASHIRLRNVDSTSFELQIEEWDYLDQWHTTEEIAYVVMEKGHYNVDGVEFDVGSESLRHDFKTVTYNESFNQTPMVLSQSQTYNGWQAIVTRQQNVGTNSFQVKLKEEEGNDGTHAYEDVGYIAIETGNAMLGSRLLNVSATPDNVTHAWSRIDFDMMSDPFFFSMMQDHDGGDTAGIRHKNLGSNSVEIMIEEEQSKDSETNHTTEVVGYMILDGVGTISVKMMCRL
ncbi:hypothetical protein COT97_05395 [Candidatus Falkowbacteria bacterium CG10_big_fil_rev_8_21_14_0_10_39_11]|uniref:Uncharacterized protein n=1 Tax=Candidatus Falkowbacteria bacterium CG10_big_fil_rev_8_21_14_0_10_39_11 TaxID=1974565 RepID=A0A2H0V3R4_9BACT|nr:MAG: hypothetical protein COT97_05395 [Candidatus Falkowbacteria bacterium CG10_big_fil_rev_8_21_14_0_10_39_11]